MPKTLISVDPKKEPWNQDTPLHNRWHPDIVSLSNKFVHKICTKYICILLIGTTCIICNMLDMFSDVYDFRFINSSIFDFISFNTNRHYYPATHMIASGCKSIGGRKFSY